MDAFAGYPASLAGSWEALAEPHADASVVRGDGFIAARFPRHPVLCNAIPVLGVPGLWAFASAGHEAGARGFETASLQSTPMAQQLYAAKGFIPVSAWQEWLPTKA